MFALSDACKYSLSKVPYLEREEKIDLTNLTWQLQKSNLKRELRRFKLNTLISYVSFSLSNVSKFEEKKKKVVVLCFHLPQNMK